MLLKYAVLGGLVASAYEVDDDTTLLQLHNMVTSDSPVDKAIRDFAKAKSPVEASLIVEDLTEKVVRGQVSIDDTTKDALNTMLGTLAESETLMQQSHEEDSTLRNNAAELVGSCKTSYDASRAEDAEIGGEMAASDDSHEICRTALKQLDNEKTNRCNELTSFISGLTPPSCSKPAARDGMQGYFDGLKNHYDSNYNSWKEKNDACVAAENNVVLKDAECDTIQRQFETKFCSYRLEMHTTCSEYVGCYANAKAEFYGIMATTGASQEKRQLEWTAIQKIKCYIGVLVADEDTDRKAELGKCQELDPDVSALKLEDPTLDDKETCNLSPVANFPCTADFVAARYSGMIGLLDCEACPALPGHIDVDNGHICRMVQDSYEDWSNTKHAVKDGVVYMGGFDRGQQTVSKTFNLIPGVEYKLSVVLDTWASVDKEEMKIKAHDKELKVTSRAATNCGNEWTAYPYGTGTFVGSSGSGTHNWQDCWRSVEMSFTAPASGKTHVEMFAGIDQHIGDEAWGWHDLKLEPVNCPPVVTAPATAKLSGTCTCTMTSDNDIDWVYVDGVDVTHEVSNYDDLGNWPTNNVLKFECSELTKMAVQASDGNGGGNPCQGGGFGMKCSSTNVESPWHELSTGSQWKAWGGQCQGPCTYAGKGGDKNTFVDSPADWFAKDFDDSNWKNANIGNYIGQRTGASQSICSEDGPAWLFRSPNFLDSDALIEKAHRPTRGH